MFGLRNTLGQAPGKFNTAESGPAAASQSSGVWKQGLADDRRGNYLLIPARDPARW
jgi:hypothetical protein